MIQTIMSSTRKVRANPRQRNSDLEPVGTILQRILPELSKRSDAEPDDAELPEAA